MPIDSDPHYVGRAWIAPDRPVVAGEVGTWTLGYEVGAYGYDERARLKIACRFASDWATPQFTDPAGPSYATVRLETRSATAKATIRFSLGRMNTEADVEETAESLKQVIAGMQLK